MSPSTRISDPLDQTTDDVVHGPRTRVARVTQAIVLAAMALIGSFAIGRQTSPQPIPPVEPLKPPPNFCIQGRPCQPDPRPHRLATAILLGQTREDGLTYGEFLRRRVDRLCPGSRLDLESAITNAFGPTNKGIYLWYVRPFRYGGSCAAMETNPLYAGGVWADNGEIIPFKMNGTGVAHRPERGDETVPRLLRTQPKRQPGSLLNAFWDTEAP
jgi:hypothetical protein